MNKKIKIKKTKNLKFEKTTLNTNNQIIKSGLYVLKCFFGNYFPRNDRKTIFNTKNQIISILSKNHTKLELSQTKQNNKIYNSKNCNRINFIHTKLKFHTKN